MLCDDLKAEAEQLWRDVEARRVDDLKAEERLTTLVNRWLRATQRVNMETHNHDNSQAAKDAYMVMVERYAR